MTQKKNWKYEKKVYFATKYARFMKNQQKNKYKNIKNQPDFKESEFMLR